MPSANVTQTGVLIGATQALLMFGKTWAVLHRMGRAVEATAVAATAQAFTLGTTRLLHQILGEQPAPHVG